SAVGGPGAAWLPRLSLLADTVAFGALAFLPALLLHTHLIVATNALADTASVRLAAIRDGLRRWHRPLVSITYAPLVLLPVALFRLADATDPDPLARLRGFERPFVIWIVWAHLVAMVTDFVLARHSRKKEEGRLYLAVGLTFSANAALFIVTFLAGANRLRPGVGPILVSISLLSSLAPACVFAYFVYRYNALGLFVRRGALAGVAAAVMLFGYVFVLREISSRIESLYGLDPRLTDAALLAAVLIGLAPFAGRIRERVFGVVFPAVARQRALSRQVGASLHNVADRAALAAHVATALKAAFHFEAAALVAGDSGDPLLSLIPAGASAVARAEVADEDLGREMDKHGAACVVPVRHGVDQPLMGALIVGPSREWPLMSSEDAAPLIELASQMATALEHVGVVEANVTLERRLQQEKHLATIGRLAATVAHEVKNPLGAIKTIVQVMQEQSPDDRDLRMIVSEIDRLAGTVHQLLLFARMQDRAPGAAPGAPRPSFGNPAAALTQAARLFRADADRRGISLDASVNARVEALGACVGGITTDQLSEVFSNLIVNALQADSRRVVVSATVAPTTRGAGVRVMVEDDGHGIPGEQQARVFEPFFTTRQRGTGLGLAIVNQQIRMVGGTIRLESPVSEGRGTRFVIELPVTQSA
ncbi:MAG: hypothetical protein HY654_04700, partial [Acidobacteria bacterium]|nr:hypothetical protein [Acidobacteriota bacterium]